MRKEHSNKKIQDFTVDNRAAGLPVVNCDTKNFYK